MFKIINTWKNPASATQQQRGFPSPGTGAQRTGQRRPRPGETTWFNATPMQGADTWLDPSSPVDAQRGFPAPENPNQGYRAGDLTQPKPDGSTYYRVTREFSRGAQRSAPITPILMSTPNPGSVVPHKPSVCPRYPLGQYINNTIWWTNQVIPTSVPLSGLQTEKAVAAMLATFHVYGEAPAL